MRQGAVISGSAHVILVAAALIGLPEREFEDQDITERITDVSIVALSDFQAAQSAAPDTPETPDVALSVPEEEISEPERPREDTQPQRVEDVARPDAPPAGEAPNLELRDTVEPEVALELELPEAAQDEGSVGIDTPLPNAQAQDGSINSNNLALLAPATPNLAPRIDTSAAPKPPKPVPEAPKPVEERAPEEAPEPEPEPEPQPEAPAAPKEATTEITPDAEVQENPTTPRAAARPRGRPNNLAADAEKKRKEAEAVAAALAEAEKEATEQAAARPAPAPQETGTRLGQNFSSGEAQAIGDVISKSWNKTLIEGKDQFERLVVIVRVRMNADGTVQGGVEPVRPRSPDGDFKVAFEAARRAVLRAQPIPLPRDKFRDGDYLEIRFDPGRSTISLD